MNELPDNFSAIYNWCEGAMPPPNHFEYCIRIGPGTQGEITFWPDYPQHHPPVWQEVFDIPIKALEYLLAKLIESDALRNDWPELENVPVGDSQEWLRVEINQQSYRIPSVLEHPVRFEGIYDFIRKLVPSEIWIDFKARQEQFEQNYSRDN